jgi:transposase InsO family protein
VAKPSVTLKRAIVSALVPEYGSVTSLCRLVGLAESSYYHAGPGHVDAQADHRLLTRLEQLAGRHPTYGYRRLTKLVRRRTPFAGVNSKRVRRVLKAAGIQAKKATRAVFTTDTAHGFPRYPNLVRALAHIDHPDQVWCCDITYIALATGEVVFLAIVLDVFTRCIRGGN